MIFLEWRLGLVGCAFVPLVLFGTMMQYKVIRYCGDCEVMIMMMMMTIKMNDYENDNHDE